MEIEISQKNMWRNSNTWRLNKRLLSNSRINEEIKGKMRFLESNDNEETIYIYLWYKAKTVLWGKTHSKTGLHKEKNKIHNLNAHHKFLENQEVSKN